MQINIAISILTIQATENPKQREQILNIIEIISTYTTIENTTVDAVLDSMYKDIQNNIDQFPTECNEYSYRYYENIIKAQNKLNNLTYLYSLEKNPLLNKQKIMELKIFVNDANQKIFDAKKIIIDSISPYLIPKLKENYNMYKTMSQEQLYFYVYKKQFGKYSAGDVDNLLEIKAFINCFDSSTSSVQSPEIIELISIMNDIDSLFKDNNVKLASHKDVENHKKMFNVNSRVL